MKKLSTLFTFFLAFTAFAQESYTISGYVSDSASAERLIGVNIYIPGTTIGTTSNTYGFYSLTVKHKEVKLEISYMGYSTQLKQLSLDGNKQLDINLSSSSEKLNEVEVRAEQIAAMQPQMSTVRLTAKDIKSIPAFLGEVDVIKALQLLPGVQSGGEGTTGFYVRGGSPDQNLILLDGVPVYNASHLFGFFSVFNADAIKNVQLSKGGFPARFGGRLSSVLEIDLKEGNMKEFHGEGSIGVVASRFTLEGPLVKDKTSFIVSARRTYIDILAQPFIMAAGEVSAGYYFGDLNTKINHVFSRKDRLYLSYYTGIDKFYYRDKSYWGGDEMLIKGGLKWGNHTGSLRWNHLFSDKLFGNLTATFTQYRFSVYSESETDVSNIAYEYLSLIQDKGLRYDLEYLLNSNHKIQSGINYTYHTFRPGAVQTKLESPAEKIDSLLNLSRPIYAHDAYVYVEDDWQINAKWRANYGLHYSAYTADGAFYNSLQPRVSARYLLNDEWSVKGSYAMMNQYIHLLSNSGFGMPTDLWVSSTAKVKPQLSQQIALGTTRNLFQNQYEFSAEVYYKWMNNLIEYKEGAFFLSNTDWQNTVETNGKGEAYGLELFARKNEGATTGWIGYTLAWSNRQFDNLNFGEKYPYKYDRRHDISVVINHKFSDRFDMGMTWVYGTGNAFTAPLSKIVLIDDQHGFSASEFQRFSSRNELRFPAYHRMDIGFNFHKEKRWGTRTWNVSLYNAYNRRNPYFLDFTENNKGKKQVKQYSLFPIIPSVSYIFKF